jgi:high-affinity nickel-transport protein
MQLGQLPVTCGLFFSLGHSTIVVIFIVAIAISTDVFDKAGGFGDVGGIIGEDPGNLIQYMGPLIIWALHVPPIGSSISGSFLFLIGVANSITLYKVVKRRRAVSRRVSRWRLPTNFDVSVNERKQRVLCSNTQKRSNRSTTTRTRCYW